ncbi:MAG: tetratricopeptide repeat protein, partial [Elainellaceae cyanobacterium]
MFQKDLYRKRQAACCLEQGQYAEAIALYEQSLETDPTCALSYWNLGLALLLTGDEMSAQLCWASGLSQAAAGTPEFDDAQLLLFLHQAADQYQSMQRQD